MKKVLFTILMVLLLGTSNAQHSQDNYVFATLNGVVATNLMASTNLSYPFECKLIGVSTGMDWTGFFTDNLAGRVRANLDFHPTVDPFHAVSLNAGLGILVSTRDGYPYGFVEFRPRFITGGTTLAYSEPNRQLFITSLLGVGWNVPITPELWFSMEGGVVQNFSIIAVPRTIARDEVGAFLTVGVRYLINKTIE
jgi:hypothetical protein